MKRLFRYVCVLIAALTLVSMFGVMNASAANGTTIDASNAKYGFVTVNYTSSAKLKVGIQYQGGKIAYKNCPSGKDAVFSLEQGDGTYTITLCENISGTTYRIVTSKRVNAKIENEYAPYLIATADVQFTSGGAVEQEGRRAFAKTPRPTPRRSPRSTTTSPATTPTTPSSRTTSPPARSASTSPTPPRRSIATKASAMTSLPLRRYVPQPEHSLLPHQGLRRQQLPRLEQGQRGRQLVPDRPHLRRDQTCAERRRICGLRLPLTYSQQSDSLAVVSAK